MHLAYNVQRQKQTEYNSIKQIHCHCIHNVVNRVGETGLFPVSTSHTTVRTVRYTAVH